MRIRFWETSRNSYTILEVVVPMMKIIGALAILGSVLTAFGVATDESLTFIDSDARATSAVAIGISGIVTGLLLMAVGAAIDVYMGIDAMVQRVGRRLDGFDTTDDFIRAAQGG